MPRSPTKSGPLCSLAGRHWAGSSASWCPFCSLCCYSILSPTYSWWVSGSGELAFPLGAGSPSLTSCGCLAPGDGAPSWEATSIIKLLPIGSERTWRYTTRTSMASIVAPIIPGFFMQPQLLTIWAWRAASLVAVVRCRPTPSDGRVLRVSGSKPVVRL
jgi:hypothetical protein